MEAAIVDYFCVGDLRESLLRIRQAQASAACASHRNVPLVVDAMQLLDVVPEVHPFLRDWNRLMDFLHAAASKVGCVVV